MKLPVSNKTGSFSNKPHIKKGYYPAKFTGYKATKTDSSDLEGQYGKMIILEFSIFKPTEDGVPQNPVTITEGNVTKDVTLDKFVYITYKDKKTNEHQTAFTPNSKPTKMFKALGWEPDFEGETEIDIDGLVGKWVEVLISDYETKDGNDEAYICSSIGDLTLYKAEAPSKEVEEKAEKVAKNSKPKEVKKQVKHEDIKEKKENPNAAKIAQLDKLKEEGLLTEEGHKQAMEQLGA